MAGSRWAALAVVGAIATVAVGCGSGSDTPSVTNIAVVTPGARDDADWTRQTTDAAKAAAKKLHVRTQVVEGTAETPVKPTLTRLARNAQLVIAPFGPDGAEAAKVAASTEVPALVWGDPSALRPGLVGDVEADIAGGAFAAGALAAHASRSESVGIVLCDDGGAGWDMPQRFAIAAAFVAGARADNPKAKAAFVIAGSDEAGAKQATIEVVKQGSQMVLAICGPAAPGVMSGIEQAIKGLDGEAQMVALVGDKGTINRENVVITSVLVNPAVAFEQAIRDVRTDRFGKRVYKLDIANRGITLLQTGRTPGDAYEAALKLKPPAELPTAGDEVELDALIRG